MNAASPKSPIVDLAGQPQDAIARLIAKAADLKASDVFLASEEDYLAVSFRLHGLVQLVGTCPAEMGRKCLSHIKAAAGMDVAEKRRPLDGRWIFNPSPERTIDLRISTIPTLNGEDMAIRLLDRDNRLLSLDQLGLIRRDYNHLQALLASPSGLILVTGPTGSGKTTTLYACLNHLKNGVRKLNTIEDPIEYSLAGIRQSQVSPKIGLDFAELLRNVLRQAPDVIMIGEIRDAATAEVAVRAAASGHLVLATLHAPTAAAAVQSMLALGVHRHFLASALRGAIAQRLVRTLCPACRTELDIAQAPQAFDDVRRFLPSDKSPKFFAAGKCDQCHGQGYAGRSGVFEVMPVTHAIRQIVATPESTTQMIRKRAVEDGIIDFQRASMLKVALGETTVEEVLRAIPAESLGLEGEAN